MAGMPWVKVYTEMLDDVKLSRLSDAQRWRFIQLILLAGECDAGGALVTGDSRMTHEDVCWRLRCDSQTLESDLSKLIACGLITDKKGVLTVSKFNDRQGPTQEEKRESWRKRQEAHRNRVKTPDVTGDSPDCHATEEEEEKEKEEEKRGEEEPLPQPSVYTSYSNNIGLLTQMVSDSLDADIKDYSEAWVEDAIQEAVRNEVRKLSYIEGILKNWKTNGRGNGKGKNKLDDADTLKARLKADAEKYGYA